MAFLFPLFVQQIQTQACQQVMDEAEKEYKKMTERIGESREAMKVDFILFFVGGWGW